MSVEAPPKPAHRGLPADRDEFDAIVEALIEEARQRARRRRRRNGAFAILAMAIGLGVYVGIGRVLPADRSAAAADSQDAVASGRSAVRNGPITLFVARSANSDGVAGIETAGPGTAKMVWRCPRNVWCGQPVSFAWSHNGERVAFSLDEIGGNSSYVGLHVVDVVTGRDTQIPPGAPPAFSSRYHSARDTYLRKAKQRVGCWPAAEIAWSPDGSSLAYRCDPNLYQPVGPNAHAGHINLLRLNGSGYQTIPILTAAHWPSWSPAGNRIAYSIGVRPNAQGRVFTVALDGSQQRLIATGAAAPAWSPDGTTIAYQTRCGIRLATPEATDVTPRLGRNGCGAIGLSGPPVWSPDGNKIAVETKTGVYVFSAKGGRIQRVTSQATPTWYGALPGRPAWQPIKP
jgi:hypothetical protein